MKKETKFAERFRALRKQYKISQVALGKMLGFGYTTISNYESGRNEPSLGTLVEIANYFNVSVDYLLGIEDEKNTSVDK